MKTLLIVEDEKMIRRGIATMAARSSVEIGEIIECRNGIEAMEILNSRQIDTVFTDIRMPKMDGIELVARIDLLEEKPDIIVISGYDDFNYAVEMLKHGVSDYILKPVKRDKIEEVLINLQDKQDKAHRKQEGILQSLQNQMKYFLLSDLPEEEWKSMEQQYTEIFRDEPYAAAVYAPDQNQTVSELTAMYLDNVEGQEVVFVPRSVLGKWEERTAADCIGISSVHDHLKDCRCAYQEAKAARVEAFVKGRHKVVYEKKEEEQAAGEKEDDLFAEQFAQKFSTKDRDEAVRKLLNMQFDAKHGKIAAERILYITGTLQRRLLEMYRPMIPEENKELLGCLSPLSFRSMDEYMEKLKEWMDALSDCLAEQFVNDQNKRKIREAVRYIRENYQKDLNMALVSNYVSMNYSLFSIAFKEYTGINFVNYLKEIRVKNAKKLLEETDWKIQDIGRMVGYENDKHFMKTFKSICGVSPSEYRRNLEVSGRTS